MHLRFISLLVLLVIFIWINYPVTALKLIQPSPSGRGFAVQINHEGQEKLTRGESKKIIPAIQLNDEAPKIIPPKSNAWLHIISEAPVISSATENIRSMNLPSEQIIQSLPAIGAWKTLMLNEDPPGTLSAYLKGSYVLSPFHTERISIMWDKIRNQLNLKIKDSAQVHGALKASYIALYGKTVGKSDESLSGRVAGVAMVLGEMLRKHKDGVDLTVVKAGILHEAIAALDDCRDHETIQLLISEFGSDVIDLARKYRKLPIFMARIANYVDKQQSENQLQMLVTHCEDVRCLYIRLADRLYALREISKLPLGDEEQIKIAEEALYMYAPLAHKFGSELIDVKGELEDLSFSVLNPEMFKLAQDTQVAANKAYHDAMREVTKLTQFDRFLKANGVRTTIYHRSKGKYQLFLKMQRKGLASPSEVRDAFGMRIIVDLKKKRFESKEEREKRAEEICYYLVNKIRSLNDWEPSEDGFKDYISDCKENGYKSLHQYIRHVELGSNVEVQVRTKQMHTDAELGNAAHWHYKDQIYRPEITSLKLYRIAWRSEQQINCTTTADFFRLAREQILRNRVLVFLNDRSKVVNLDKKEVTALDAAFHVHTHIGLRTSDIAVNGQRVDFSFNGLQNGDVISVNVTSNISLSNLISWLSIVRSTQARQGIKTYLRDNHPGAIIFMGIIQLLMTISLSRSIILDHFNGKMPDIHRLAKMCKDRLGKSFDKFLREIGEMKKDELRAILGRLLGIPGHKLSIASFMYGLGWAQMQRNQWEDAEMKDQIILPLLNDVLPSLGCDTINKLWCEIIGEDSLMDHVKIFDLADLDFAKREAPKEISMFIQDSVVNKKPIRNSLPHDLYRSTNFMAATKASQKILNQSLRPLMKPYCLEAPSLSDKWMRISKQSYVARAIQKERRMIWSETA